MPKRIGEMHAFALRNLDLFGITPLRSVLSPALLLEAQERPAHPWTILIPEIVFWLMATVAMTGQSMAGAVTGFWSIYGDLWALPSVQPVTEEAFCIARRKLKGRFLQEGLRRGRSTVSKVFSESVSLERLAFTWDRRHESHVAAFGVSTKVLPPGVQSVGAEQEAARPAGGIGGALRWPLL